MERIARLGAPHPILPALLCFVILAAGCDTPVGVRRVGREKVYRETTANALSSGTPSLHSTQVLERANLGVLWEKDRHKALEALYKRADQELPFVKAGAPAGSLSSVMDLGRDLLFALSELSSIAAAESGRREDWLATVVYAHTYLFHPAVRGALDPFDPRFRLAADIYNSALTESLRKRDGDIDLAGGTFELPFGTLRLGSSRPGFPWGPEEFDRFVPAQDFRIRGLRERNRVPGLGTPLIALRTRRAAPADQGPPKLAHTTIQRAIFPATAVIRPTVVERDPSGRLRIDATIELYATFNVHEVELGGIKVPLEADLTAPIAYALQESPIWKFEIQGLFSDTPKGLEPGLYLVEPYTPGKIPLVLVHGTASSPARWAETLNGLKSYREIREGYQIWLFIYPTGNPILYSSYLLRKSLEEAMDVLDPERRDPALRRMVLAGHSQGGLLVKLQSIDSGGRLWDSLVQRNPAVATLPAEQQERLRGFVECRPLPFVQQAVYIATPHRGSYQAGRWYSRIVSSLIAPPRLFKRFLRDILKDDMVKIPEEAMEKIPTSFDQMTTDNPFIKLLASIPTDPSVHAHSIIPVKQEGPPAEGDDGVVRYKDAHIDEADSELVVPSGHSCQGHPFTILELRRILREHLATGRGEPAAATVGPAQ